MYYRKYFPSAAVSVSTLCSVVLVSQAQEQLHADVLRYKAKIEDLQKELTLKGQVEGLLL